MAGAGGQDAGNRGTTGDKGPQRPAVGHAPAIVSVGWPSWNCKLAIVALGFLAVLFTYFAVRVVGNVKSPPRGDFGVFYRAGQDIFVDQRLYNVDVAIDQTFKSAPVLALTLAAIDWLPARAARLVWYLVDLCLLGVIFASSYRLLYPDGRWSARRGWIAFATLLITLRFVLDQLHTGQPTTLWVALCILTFTWAAQGKPGRAGLGLALAVCVKVVPLCFAPQLLLRGRPLTALLSFVGGLALLLLVPAISIGWDANARLALHWGSHLNDTLMPQMLLWISNQSLYSILARFLGPSEYGSQLANLDMPSIGRIWLATSCLLAAGLYAWMVVALRGHKTERRDAAMLSLLLIYMTICNPLAWKHNFIALIFPYFFVLESVVERRDHRRLLISLLGASYLINSLKSQITGFAVLDAIQICGGRFWGAIVLGIAVLIAYSAANRKLALVQEQGPIALRAAA